MMLIGTDRMLFASGSSVRQRIARFGSEYTDALDSIVFSTREHGVTKSDELGPQVHAYSTNSCSRFLYGWDAFRIARRLPRPDIVSAQDPFETGLIALCIARFFGVPLAVEIHTDFLSPSFMQHSLLNRFRVLLAGFVLRHAAGGYAVSEKMRDGVMQRYKHTFPLRTLPIYIDVERFTKIPHIPHERFKTALLWVGRLEPEKNPELALTALLTVRHAGFDAGLTFVGDGRLAASLKERVRALGLGEWVEFAGVVPDVAPYYARTDLLLVTSQYEGYGMVIVEALAAGVPVLATDVGIAREAGASIATGSYANALTQWFAAPRSRGSLKMHLYKNEEEYLAQVYACYAALLS